MCSLRIPVKLAISMLAIVGSAAANDEIITRQDLKEILTELREIRQLLERPQQGKPNQPAVEEVSKAKLSFNGAPMLGSKDAPVTIVEFTDYECPFCQGFQVSTFDQLKAQYIDTGKVRFVSRDLPLKLHTNAMGAAQATRCANDQGLFWQMRDRISNGQSKLKFDDLLGIATDLKMDIQTFKQCVQSEKYKGAIDADAADAMKIGVAGTPTFIVGTSTSDGVDGEIVVGAISFAELERRIQQVAVPVVVAR